MHDEPNLPPCFARATPARLAAATALYLVGEPGGRERASELMPASARILTLAGFRGELNAVVPATDGVFVGLGDGSEPFALGAASARLPEGDYVIANATAAASPHLAALGWGLGAYRFTRYRKPARPPVLLLQDHHDVARLSREVAASWRVRDLVNTPAEDMGPADLVTASQSLAGSHGADVTVYAGSALADGCPLIHAVGRAAARPPCLIDLRWGDPAHPAVTLVGKGVCFDSGGLNVKTGTSMSLMKKDMGGAATVLGLAEMIMGARLQVRLRVLIPAVENAIAGNAFRPGDVFRARNGLTVEISNTDAEGRLVLADAMALAAEENPTRIISLATLTGAARTALGPDLPPAYSTDDAFLKRLVETSHALADPVWPMPMWRRYDDYLSSSVADVNHASGNGYAGSVVAALFLRRFVPAHIAYTHLDIFAWVPNARPGRPVGGEAQGMRALFATLEAS